jgi:hypothetical protein
MRKPDGTWYSYGSTVLMGPGFGGCGSTGLEGSQSLGSSCSTSWYGTTVPGTVGEYRTNLLYYRYVYPYSWWPNTVPRLRVLQINCSFLCAKEGLPQLAREMKCAVISRYIYVLKILVDDS